MGNAVACNGRAILGLDLEYAFGYLSLSMRTHAFMQACSKQKKKTNEMLIYSAS